MNKPLDYIYPSPPEGLDPKALDLERIPKHVALIMDGNGRWAKARGKNRLSGHKAGIEAVRESIRMASDLGIRYLTIYSFSSENWKRPPEEVIGLMDLFAKTMLAEVAELHKEHVRVKTIGDLSMLPPKTRDAFKQAWETTKDNSGMTLVVAVNYGGRREIVDAAAAFAQAAREARERGEELECSEIVRSMPGHDIVVVEGYRKSGLPSIEIMRSGNTADANVARVFVEGAKRGFSLERGEK